MAEALFRQMAAQAGLAIEVLSVGVAAMSGAPATPASERALRPYRLSLARHVARPLEAVGLQPGDLVLTMTRRQRDLVRARFPTLADRVHVLKEYVGAPGDPDVADPFGGDDEEYEACARELYELMRKLVDKLARE
jgi:protein-tyrosine-phosphatase